MGQFDLALFVCKQKSFCSLQHAEPSALESRRVFAAANAFATGFDADHSYLSIFEKGMKQADGVAPAADAGHKQIGKTFLALENLTARFDADHALKIAHHHRVRMRAERRPQYIMSGADVCDPIAHCF